MASSNSEATVLEDHLTGLGSHLISFDTTALQTLLQYLKQLEVLWDRVWTTGRLRKNFDLALSEKFFSQGHGMPPSIILMEFEAFGNFWSLSLDMFV